jgi:integrase
MEEGEARQWWTKAREEAGIENLRWHDLRHTFATRLMASSKNLKVVKEACGHGSIATTTIRPVIGKRVFD